MIELPLGSTEEVYGFGLQLYSLRQSNKKRTIRVNADPHADSGDSHAPAPFYVTTSGYGVLVDTARYAAFHTGGAYSPRDVVPVVAKKHAKHAGPQTSTDALYREVQAINRRMLIEIPVAESVDIYVFAGPSMAEAVQRYVLFSGGGCLPSRQGLGVLYRARSDQGSDRMLSLIESLQQDQMPIDQIGLEPGWHSACYPNTFAWSPERFPDPDRFIRHCAQRGIELNLWENAFVHPDAPFAQRITPYCGDELSTHGLIPDFLTDEARDIFGSHHGTKLIERGIAGFKLDECDNGDFISFAWSFPESTRFPSGADGEQMHSLLGTLYQSVIDGQFRDRDRRHLSQVRASHALSAPYPFVLYSDLYEHQAFIRGVVTSGLSGMLWTPEFRHANSPEDLIRRLQSMVFTAQFCINCWCTYDNPPWWNLDVTKNAMGIRDPDPRLMDLCRDILDLRQRFIPYLYSAFHRYWRSGRPPIRPLIMDHAEDMSLLDIDDQWYAGEDVIVAPLIAGQNRRTVVLPEGIWRDFWSGRPYSRGSYVIEQPLERMPLFVRDGAILPLAAPGQRASQNGTLIEPVIFGHAGTAQTELIIDDGQTWSSAATARRVSLHWNGVGIETHGDLDPAYRLGSCKTIGG